MSGALVERKRMYKETARVPTRQLPITSFTTSVPVSAVILSW
jgi:hypothetical protein